jgi:putative oxidoreductase
MQSNTRSAKLSPYLLSLLRITAGIVFIRHGMQLVFGFPFGGMNHDFTTLAGIAGPLTIVGGTLVILGLFTRPVTFFLSGMMAVAFFADSVAKNGNLWTLRDGEPALSSTASRFCSCRLRAPACSAWII